MRCLILILDLILFLQVKTVAQDEFLIDTISTVYCEQHLPDITSDGNEYMIVWTDSRNGHYQIHGSIVDRFGTVLNKIEVSEHLNRWFPSVAFDGNHYMVVYNASWSGWWYGAVLGQKFNKNGFLVSPDEYVIYSDVESGGMEPEIFNGLTNYLVAFHYTYHNRIIFQVRGCILYTNGTVGSNFGNLHAAYTYIGGISFDNENYFVVFERTGYLNLPPIPSGVYGVRIDTAGVLIDTSATLIQLDESESPSVAFDGTNYLVVWQEKNSDEVYDIYGARVTPSVEVLDTLGIPISTADSNQVNPEIVFNGENYIVVWEDYRNGIEPDIYGAKVDTDGHVIDSFPISTEEGEQIHPALWKGSGNQVLVVYSGWTGEHQGKTYNSMRIWGKMLGVSSDVEDGENNLIVSDYELEQNYPNPFNPSTKIRYDISKTTFTTLKVYDVLGNEIETLVNEEKQAGTYEIPWYAENLPSGVYFYRLQAGSFVETKKMVLLR